MTIQTSRIDSREDSCHFIKDLAYLAASPTARASVYKYIQRTPLADCNKYAHDLSK